MDDKPDPNHPPIGGVPFNERAALEELEHFRREIERYQALRHGVNHEFEHFVQSFKHPESARPVTQAYTPPPAAVPAPKPAPPPEPFIAPAPIAAPTPVVVPKPPTPPAETFQPSRRIESPRAETLPAPAAELTSASPAKRALKRPSVNAWIAIGVIVILVVGGYAWMTTSTDDATPASATPQQSAAVPTAPSATQTPPAQPAAPPPTKPLPYEAVLTTTGPVWVRLIADGERVFERELPAGERIPFTARESIVIRAGNPASVRLTIGGIDQGALGREGFPVTRTFAVPR